MLRVWSDSRRAGVLDQHGKRGTTFVYDPQADPARAVSVTMPVRTASWNTDVGLAPIFDMNLPEGALREHLVRRFGKATGTAFEDFDLLTIVGRTQIGRIRYSAIDAELDESVPFQSIDSILRAKRDGELFDHLLDTFAVHSGLSGVQPKVMIRGSDERASTSVRGATHIVKLWEPKEFPELAANEFFCLSAAKAAGLAVPTFQLSDDGSALVVERFDLKSDGTYRGFEDFCVLNGLPTAKKYLGGYETRLFKRTGEFIDVDHREHAMVNLFKLFVLNCAIRNGDAHLKNFGILYDDVNGPASLAPVYDLVTTLPYLPKDMMALTLDGSTAWPSKRKLVQLGQSRADLSLQKVTQIFEQVADALSDVAGQVETYFKDRAQVRDVKDRILTAWNAGVKESLGFGDRILVPAS